MGRREAWSLSPKDLWFKPKAVGSKAASEEASGGQPPREHRTERDTQGRAALPLAHVSQELSPSWASVAISLVSHMSQLGKQSQKKPQADPSSLIGVSLSLGRWLPDCHPLEGTNGPFSCTYSHLICLSG